MMQIHDPALFDRLPDAILFDTDNTLYAYEPAHAAAMTAVREKVMRTFSIDAAAFDNAFATAIPSCVPDPRPTCIGRLSAISRRTGGSGCGDDGHAFR